MPDVKHFRPYLQLDRYTSSVRFVSEPLAVGQKNLFITHLNQKWWQPDQISVKRRSERIAELFLGHKEFSSPWH